ncbi:MAG: hypothetical protein KDF65_06650, partial [Anaerolineae bacterium]|nr:hypothetical protein [Anaerolineae bacterium]
MTSVALAVLIVLLQQPAWAATVIDLLNQALALVLELAGRVIDIPFETPQIEAGRPSTWLIILLVLLGLSAFLGRLLLEQWFGWWRRRRRWQRGLRWHGRQRRWRKLGRGRGHGWRWLTRRRSGRQRRQRFQHLGHRASRARRRWRRGRGISVWLKWRWRGT